jgi:HAD superfamily hydrolase (TIGR01549 family)
MINKNNIHWVFLDVGETIVDESRPLRNIIEQFIYHASEMNYNLSLEQVEEAMIYYYSQLCPHPMREVMEKFVPSEKNRDLIRNKMKYNKELEQPYPEAQAVLKYLSEHYQIGIIANQNVGTSARLELYGLMPYISLVCSSAEAGFVKPDLRFFEMALEQAKCKSQHAVMIGDRLDNDIFPAKHLGMQAIWIRQGFAREQEVSDPLLAPDAVIERLNDMVTIL